MTVSTSAVLAKLATAILGSEKGRRKIGWLLAAVFSPLILVLALFCSLGEGGAEHNHAVVDACFYGGVFEEQVPQTYREHVLQMQSAFSALETSVSSVNAETEGDSLDPLWVKAVFFALCFGEDAPNQREADRFVSCFYRLEERSREVTETDENGETSTETETYMVAVPCSTEESDANLAAELGREITETDRQNIAQVKAQVTGGMGIEGGYERHMVEDGRDIDLSGYVDLGRKNAKDLATYAIHAWEQGWGYVWGSHGEVLTEMALAKKLTQYPEQVGGYETFIRANWLNKRTADCVGLIKGYGWLNSDTLTFLYGSNGMQKGNPAQAQRSGLRGERRCNGMDELPLTNGREGYGVCIDEWC